MNATGGAIQILPLSTAHRVPVLRLGEMASDFEGLESAGGGVYNLESFHERPLLVLAFLGDACPAVKACVPALVAFQQHYSSSGVQVVGLNSNNPYLSPTDTLEEMRRWAADRRLNFPYLKDPGGQVARRFGARNTPHFLVLDSDRRLRYRGRMFDSREPERATTHDLEQVVDALLAGQPWADHEATPLGCSIVW